MKYYAWHNLRAGAENLTKFTDEGNTRLIFEFRVREGANNDYAFEQIHDFPFLTSFWHLSNDTKEERVNMVSGVEGQKGHQ